MSQTSNDNTARQTCLNELVRLAALHPTTKITREFVRHNAKVSIHKFDRQFPRFDEALELIGLAGQGKKPKGPVNKHVKPNVPMSEDPDKPNSATEQECVNDLKNLAEENPTKVISRNFYRVKGSYAESAWNAHFGTFEEFKRQAGVKLSRQQHLLEKNLAKHASVDHYRAFNVEREKFAEKYARPSGSRFQLIVALVDGHDKECDPFVKRVAIDTIKRAQPETVILGGDMFDLPEFGKYTVDPRTWDVAGRIKFVHEDILNPIRTAAPNAQIDFIEGNHEFRLLRHLADATPAMRSVLADLHGFTVAKLLGLDKFEINYVAKADLAAYTSKDVMTEVRRNYKIYHNCFLAHHTPEGRALGLPGFCGHHHKYIAWAMSSAVFGAYNFLQLGAMHRMGATYCDGEKWSNGFLMAHIDTKTQQVAMEYVDVRHDFACVGGKYYYREKGEN